MSEKPNENPCYNNKRENNPNQSNYQNARPRRTSRNDSQNVNFSNTSGIYQINPYDSNPNSPNCCMVHSTPNAPSTFPNQSSILSQDFTISQTSRGGYNFTQSVPQNTSSPYQYMNAPQVQGGPSQQRGCCSSSPQGYTPGYYNPPQRSQQQYSYSPQQISQLNASRKQQVSFQSPTSNAPISESERFHYGKCPHQVYIKYTDTDPNLERPRASIRRKSNISPEAIAQEGEETAEAQEANETTAQDATNEESTRRQSRSIKPSVCSPMNPCCSPHDIYQFELPRTTETSDQSSCPPSSTCKNHSHPMDVPCPPESPCFIKNEVIFSQPRPSSTRGSMFAPYKPVLPACCQLGFPAGLEQTSGEIPRTPCLPTSPCARSYVLTNKSINSTIAEETLKCCQNAYNYSKIASLSKSSCGQMQNLDGASCGTSCLSAQSCTSNKSKTGRSRIPQRTSSTGSGGKFRKQFIGKANREDTKIDSINMLSVVISTVMFLAAELPEVPDTYLKWSKIYLKCIKNLQGQSPPNIRKFLKMLPSEDDTEDSDNCKCPFSGKSEDESAKSVVAEAAAPE